VYGQVEASRHGRIEACRRVCPGGGIEACRRTGVYGHLEAWKSMIIAWYLKN
jgi:hypothetical protein